MSHRPSLASIFFVFACLISETIHSDPPPVRFHVGTVDPLEPKPLLSSLSPEEVAEMSDLEYWDAKNPVQEIERLERWPTPWVFSYHIEVGSSQVYVDSNDDVSVAEFAAGARVLATEVTRRRQNLVLAWNPTQSDEIRVTVPLNFSKATLRNDEGGRGLYDEIGVGDAAVDYIRYFHTDLQHTNWLSVGVGVPTGKYDETIRLSDGSVEVLPYALQMGKGHYQARAGFGHQRPLDAVSDFGYSFEGSVPVGQNDRDYRHGARVAGRVFYERDVCSWLTLRPRLTARWSDRVDGQDPEYAASDSPVHDPSNYGGTSVDLGLVGVYYFPGDPYRTRYLLLGLDYTFWRDTPGVQLAEEWVTQLGLGWRF